MVNGTVEPANQVIDVPAAQLAQTSFQSGSGPDVLGVRAFDGFDPHRVARYDRRKVQQLLRNPGIVRNRLKIASTVANAKVFLRVQEEFGSFDRYIWQFVDGKPRVNQWKSLRQIPARTEQSDAVSKDLKRRGFNFVGSTICYALMQAVGMVNDHSADCFRYKALVRPPT